jgi:hypothetical protein
MFNPLAWLPVTRLALIAAGSAPVHDAGSSLNWGDVPTWLLFVGAVAAGVAAFRQLSVMQEDSRRRTAQLERAQADQIDVVLVPSSLLPPGVTRSEVSNEEYWFVEVRNNSRRPIREVGCVMVPHLGLPPQFAAQGGELASVPLPGGRSGSTFIPARAPIASVLRVGDAWGFLFSIKVNEYTFAEFTAHFTDDAGLRWMIDHNLHLKAKKEPRRSKLRLHHQ